MGSVFWVICVWCIYVLFDDEDEDDDGDEKLLLLLLVVWFWFWLSGVFRNEVGLCGIGESCVVWLFVVVFGDVFVWCVSVC